MLAPKEGITLTAVQMGNAERGPVPLGEGIRLSGTAIKKGHVLWLEDVSELTEVLSDLKDTSSYLKGKRKVLQKEYETNRKQQKAVEKIVSITES